MLMLFDVGKSHVVGAFVQAGAGPSPPPLWQQSASRLSDSLPAPQGATLAARRIVLGRGRWSASALSQQRTPGMDAVIPL